ncbi:MULTISPECIES: alpha/beta hydrolase [Chitinophaga]|uniref:alpha/beta hydrolase n=1 Tax=Chitinophaga TaxID=79328 RepID=UPI000DBA9BA7|nr:alpha/beta hydrolase [Chitinophaga ginsengisegetis]MDR6567873.1 putative esterase [Chitinophaga ginsengisegetis]MDR6647572.1 putative esterase [Chitinophaga ginsengisegetis]MDR6653922.1 putative esterase [Chitinophaga ginsengisegetis]
MDFKPMQYVYEAVGNPTAYTLLLLHGTGGDERDLLPLAGSLGKGFNILSLRGNVQEHGMPRFFRRLGMGVFDEEDVHFRTHEMVHFLKELATKEGFDINKLIAVGYSNGANIAGAVLILYPELLAGAVLFRPMQPLGGIEDSFETLRQQPVFMSAGTQDGTVDPAATAAYATLLNSNGFKVSTFDIPAGHNLVQRDITLAAEWMKDNFQ